MRLNEFLTENSHIQGSDNPEYYEKVVAQLRQALDIPEGVKLTVAVNPNMTFDSGQDGLTIPSPTDNNHIYLLLRGGLPPSQLASALAHEMVHAKQIADGRLDLKLNNGKYDVTWEGKPSRFKKYSRSAPWEIEAHTQERELLHHIIDTVGNPPRAQQPQ